MYFKVSYDEDFDTLMMHLWSKYGRELFDIDGIGKQCDMNWFAKNFFNNITTSADGSVDSNANVTDKNVISFNYEFPKPYQRYNSYYLLWKELNKLFSLSTANTIIEKQLIGDIYINDFSNVGLPYCYNFSTYDILLEGLPMITKIKSIQPKYLFSFKSQIEQFTAIASNFVMGATGFADLFIVMSYFVSNILKTRSDAHFKFSSTDDCWCYVIEQLYSLIYTINQPLRANQSPFTNVSVFDTPFLNSLCPNYIFPDGSTPNIDVVKKIQEIFLDCMNNTLSRTPATFPITTACFTVDDSKNILDTEFVDFIAKKNMKFGFINLYSGKTSTLSSCCRLRSDKNNEYFNSFGSGSTKIGSLGVVTMNLGRLGLKYKDNIGEEFYNEIVSLVNICAKINNAKRHIIKRRIELKTMPFYDLGFMDITTQYSTCGVNGLYECVKYLGYDILTDEGQEIAIKILDIINAENIIHEKAYNSPHNCEQTPSENSAIKLVKKDIYLKYNPDVLLYSNQFIPLTTEADVLDRITIQGKLDSYFSGGAICHINTEQKPKDIETLRNLIITCAKQGIVYWALNYNIQECINHHMSVGKRKACLICGEEITDNYTRVVGFLTNTKNWHKTRREEDYPNRQFYTN